MPCHAIRELFYGHVIWDIKSLLTWSIREGSRVVYCIRTLYYKIKNKTRLLGRPQPQMYPPVALNQYTLVNRTHKHYIYICFKAPQTS